jgi:hypothetical protein
VDFDGEIGTAQFALHALDAVVRASYLHDEPIHFKDVLGTELHADAASFAVSFDDLNAHSYYSPLQIFEQPKHGVTTGGA